MKTFSEFVKSKVFYPSIETVFGSHSSEEPSTLSEDKAESQLEKHSAAKQNDIHSANALEKSENIKRHSFASSHINHHLHEKYKQKMGQEHKPLGSAETKRHISALDKDLDKASIKDDTHVYTGLRESPHKTFFSEKADKPVVAHHPAYISTSTSLQKAKKFSQGGSSLDKERYNPRNSDAPKEIGNTHHVLKIHLPKGTKAGSIRDQSEYPEENEVLVHRGHDIEIHHQPTVMKDGTHVWHGKIVGRKIKS